MKIEEGFRPVSKKEQALQRLEDQENGLRPAPGVEEMHRADFCWLCSIDQELETIHAALEDPKMGRDFATEVQQILDDISALPLSARMEEYRKQLIGQLSEAIVLLEGGKAQLGRNALAEGIKTIHALVHYTCSMQQE